MADDSVERFMCYLGRFAVCNLNKNAYFVRRRSKSWHGRSEMSLNFLSRTIGPLFFMLIYKLYELYKNSTV